MRGQGPYYALCFDLTFCCNWEMLYDKLLAFSNLEKRTDALRIKLFLIKYNHIYRYISCRLEFLY